MTTGTTVRRKRDGAIGIVLEVNEREIVVKFAPTNQARNSPWGPSVDTKGDTGHFFHKFVDRMIEVA